MQQQTNQERAAEIILREQNKAPFRLNNNAAQSLTDAGLLMPDLPEPNGKGFWIPFEENQDEYLEMWVSGPGLIKVDGSRRFRKELTPEQARNIGLAFLATAHYAEKNLP